MKTFAGVEAFARARPGGAPPIAVAIGNLDGVHRGHQALLREARRRARLAGGASAVLTFTPHPTRLLAPDRAPPLITPLGRRLALCAEAGIDFAIVEPFTRAFASIEADAFVRDVVRRDLGAGDVVVGYDFSYGRGRGGNVEGLTALGRELGLGVAVIPAVVVDGHPCSSTRVRALVAAGEVGAAAELLGRPFELEGRVERGAARGRQLGFPTANLLPETELLPRLGIYAARAIVLDGPEAGLTRKAALSVGRNPTFTGSNGPVTVEAYLLDYDGDLYEHRLRLELIERLRDEQRFASIEALVAQIQADVDRVRALES